MERDEQSLWIEDTIENADTEPTSANLSRILSVCSLLNDRIDRLQKELADEKGSNKRTADIASCLANGIQPD